MKIKNFKSLKHIDLKLSNLNLFTGLNGSGKSSIIQVLLLLKQSINYLSSGTLALNTEAGNIDMLFDGGTGKDLHYNKKKNEEQILFHLEFSEQNPLFWQFQFIDMRSRLHSNAKYSEEILSKYVLFSENFQYLMPERQIPQKEYPASMIDVCDKRNLGILGEHTAFYLKNYGNIQKIEHQELLHPKAKNNTLIAQTNAWLSEISPNVSIETEFTHLKKDKVLLKYKFGEDSYNPTQVGFGLSYALPVIVALLTADKDKLIIIENPESHIHPRGQAELGKLLAAAAQTGAQLFIETHSDHILNGIRVAVKEKPEIKDSIAVFFCERIEEEKEIYSKVTPIKIDKKGELSIYPDNFLDEWSTQLYKLV